MVSIAEQKRKSEKELKELISHTKFISERKKELEKEIEQLTIVEKQEKTIFFESKFLSNMTKLFSVKFVSKDLDVYNDFDINNVNYDKSLTFLLKNIPYLLKNGAFDFDPFYFFKVIKHIHSHIGNETPLFHFLYDESDIDFSCFFEKYPKTTNSFEKAFKDELYYCSESSKPYSSHVLFTCVKYNERWLDNFDIMRYYDEWLAEEELFDFITSDIYKNRLLAFVKSEDFSQVSNTNFLEYLDDNYLIDKIEPIISMTLLKNIVSLESTITQIYVDFGDTITDILEQYLVRYTFTDNNNLVLDVMNELSFCEIYNEDCLNNTDILDIYDMFLDYYKDADTLIEKHFDFRDLPLMMLLEFIIYLDNGNKPFPKNIDTYVTLSTDYGTYETGEDLLEIITENKDILLKVFSKERLFDMLTH